MGFTFLRDKIFSVLAPRILWQGGRNKEREDNDNMETNDDNKVYEGPRIRDLNTNSNRQEVVVEAAVMIYAKTLADPKVCVNSAENIVRELIRRGYL